VLDKIAALAAGQMQAIGAQPILPFTRAHTGATTAGVALLSDTQRPAAQEQTPTWSGSAGLTQVCEAVAAGAASYKDLPVLLYHVATRQRREGKPSLGLLAPSESSSLHFWAFCADAEQAEAMRRNSIAALTDIVSKCSLGCLVACSFREGAEGGVTLAWEHDSGELTLLRCDKCGWATEAEGAPCAPVAGARPEPKQSLAEVATPGATTVAAVTQMLGVGPDRLVKTLIYRAGGRFAAALVRGDHELDETKLARALNARELRMATAQEIERLTGGPVGFSGPVGLEQVDMLADNALAAMADFVTGANQADKHLTGVNLGRDFTVQRFGDLRRAAAGDPCPACGAHLAGRPAFALGQVLWLGRAGQRCRLECSVAARDGSRAEMLALEGWLDLTAIMGAVAEAHGTESGIVWPGSLAPYRVHLLLLSPTSAQTTAAADSIYTDLGAAGLEVLYDDRDERAGVKFHDADLFGIPYLVVVGRRLEKEGVVEVRAPASGWERTVAAPQVLPVLRGELP